MQDLQSTENLLKINYERTGEGGEKRKTVLLDLICLKADFSFHYNNGLNSSWNTTYHFVRIYDLSLLTWPMKGVFGQRSMKTEVYKGDIACPELEKD